MVSGFVKLFPSCYGIPLKTIMKVLPLIVLLSCTLTSFGQKLTKQTLVAQTYELNLNVNTDEITADMVEKSKFGAFIAEGVLDAVDNVMKYVEVRFHFKNNNKVEIETDVFGERNITEGIWSIENGLLVIDDVEDSDEFNISIDEDSWTRKGNRLYPTDQDNDVEIYLERVH